MLCFAGGTEERTQVAREERRRGEERREQSGYEPMYTWGSMRVGACKDTS